MDYVLYPRYNTRLYLDKCSRENMNEEYSSINQGYIYQTMVLGFPLSSTPEVPHSNADSKTPGWSEAMETLRRERDGICNISKLPRSCECVSSFDQCSSRGCPANTPINKGANKWMRDNGRGCEKKYLNYPNVFSSSEIAEQFISHRSHRFNVTVPLVSIEIFRYKLSNINSWWYISSPN